VLWAQSRCRIQHNSRATVAITGNPTQLNPRSMFLFVLSDLPEQGDARRERIARDEQLGRPGGQMSCRTARPRAGPGEAVLEVRCGSGALAG
jgi:hypothetical protein